MALTRARLLSRAVPIQVGRCIQARFISEGKRHSILSYCRQNSLIFKLMKSLISTGRPWLAANSMRDEMLLLCGSPRNSNTCWSISSWQACWTFRIFIAELKRKPTLCIEDGDYFEPVMRTAFPGPLSQVIQVDLSRSYSFIFKYMYRFSCFLFQTRTC